MQYPVHSSVYTVQSSQYTVHSSSRKRSMERTVHPVYGTVSGHASGWSVHWTAYCWGDHALLYIKLLKLYAVQCTDQPVAWSLTGLYTGWTAQWHDKTVLHTWTHCCSTVQLLSCHVAGQFIQYTVPVIMLVVGPVHWITASWWSWCTVVHDPTRESVIQCTVPTTSMTTSTVYWMNCPLHWSLLTVYWMNWMHWILRTV